MTARGGRRQGLTTSKIQTFCCLPGKQRFRGWPRARAKALPGQDVHSKGLKPYVGRRGDETGNASDG
jgi:hypothetical protein